MWRDIMRESNPGELHSLMVLGVGLMMITGLFTRALLPPGAMLAWGLAVLVLGVLALRRAAPLERRRISLATLGALGGLIGMSGVFSLDVRIVAMGITVVIFTILMVWTLKTWTWPPA